MLTAKGSRSTPCRLRSDDVQLELVEAMWVLLEFLVVELDAQVDQLLHHADQVSAGAAGGVDDGDLAEGVANLLGLAEGEVGCVVVVDEAGEGVRVELGPHPNPLPRGEGIGEGIGERIGEAAFEVALERLAAHEGDDRSRRVVGARVVASGDQFLEDLAQHLGVDGDLDVERRRLHHGEVELVEELRQSAAGSRRRGRECDVTLDRVVQVGFLEQSTVEEWDVADEEVDAASADRANQGLLRPSKEEERQSVAVDSCPALAWTGVGVPERVEVVSLACRT